MRTYKFFAHFNRVNVQRGSSLVWTLHFRGMCIQAESIKFNVPVETRYRADGPQPRATIRGECFRVLSSSDDKRLIVL